MNKTDLIKAIAEKSGLTIKDGTKFVDAFTEVATKALSKGDDVALVGFGTFSRTDRKARSGRNFTTGRAIEIPASKSVKFKVGKMLKDAVNKRK